MAIPSIALIPSGYKASKLYSVLPTNGAGDLDFSRATGGAGTTGNATRVNQNGLLESVLPNVPRLDYSSGGCPSLLLEPQSTNLITYPRSFGSSYWTKSGASIQGDASTAGVELLGSGEILNQGGGIITLISGGIKGVSDGTSASVARPLIKWVGLPKGLYKISIIPTIISGTTVMSLYNGGSYEFNQVSISSKELYIYNPASGGDVFFSLDGTQIFNIDFQFTIKEVQGFASPHVDYPTGAFKLVEDTSASIHRIGRATFGANIQRTFKVYAKKGERDYISISDVNSPFLIGVIFNLNTGVVTSNENAYYSNPSIIKVGDYYECSVTWTPVALSVPSVGVSNGTTNSYTGDGTSGIYIFGAQLEEQASATSLILGATEGSTVTRIQDTVSKSGLSSLINSTEGTLFVEISALANINTNRQILLTSSIDNTTYVLIKYGSPAGRIEGQYRTTGNSVQGFVFHNLTDSTIPIKVAFTWKLNEFKLFINGLQVEATDTFGNVSPIGTFDKIDLSTFQGDLKNLQVYKTVLTAAEVAAL